MADTDGKQQIEAVPASAETSSPVLESSPVVEGRWKLPEGIEDHIESGSFVFPSILLSCQMVHLMHHFLLEQESHESSFSIHHRINQLCCWRNRRWALWFGCLSFWRWLERCLCCCWCRSWSRIDIGTSFIHAEIQIDIDRLLLLRIWEGTDVVGWLLGTHGQSSDEL
jgi:hypothetical protein